MAAAPEILVSSPLVPPEWVAAHGVRPRRLLPPAVTGAEGRCPWAGGIASGRGVAILAATCDQQRRAAEARPGVVHLVAVPHTWDAPEALRLYRHEMQRLSAFLQRRGGTAPDAGRLRATARAYDTARRAWRDRFATAPGAERVRALLTVFAEGRCPEASGPVAAGVPLALIGGHLGLDDLWLHEAIAAAGGAVALDATDLGERALPRDLDRRALAEDPFTELCDAWFGTVRDAFRRPDGGLLAWLGQEVEARGVRGAIFVRQPWCDLWRAAEQPLRDLLRRPAAVVELGAGPTADARSATRIQALIEACR